MASPLPLIITLFLLATLLVLCGRRAAQPAASRHAAPVVVATIITTAPHPAVPSTHIPMTTLRSMVQWAPELTRPPHLMVVACDGGALPEDPTALDIKCRAPTDTGAYAVYVTRLARDVRALLPHAHMHVEPRRTCLTSLLHAAMARLPPAVTHVNVVQHDRALTRRLPVPALLTAFRHHAARYQVVRYAHTTPERQQAYARDVCRNMAAMRADTHVEPASNLTFTRCRAWSDASHIATRRHYTRVVWPHVHAHNFMEHSILCGPLNHPDLFAGMWYLGAWDAPPFTRHLDGRHARAAPHD